ncbi:hypothetical protein PHJA_000486900 [Phtheirospermum japonicum]|uniref:Uncharacterized protein n=1 Tax=Phtheirospermum japonicum TaxID=374723 RepID=A0A830BHS7_9LAMI|nr:hypothetical protein PHJA_000486900 [Phtheirospermum japonicum]
MTSWMGRLMLFFVGLQVTALYRHIKECEDIRSAMIPVDLIKRVREIEEDVHVERKQIQQKDVKQTAAVDLISSPRGMAPAEDGESETTFFSEEWNSHLPIMTTYWLVDFRHAT